MNEIGIFLIVFVVVFYFTEDVLVSEGLCEMYAFLEKERIKFCWYI